MHLVDEVVVVADKRREGAFEYNGKEKQGLEPPKSPSSTWMQFKEKMSRCFSGKEDIVLEKSKNLRKEDIVLEKKKEDIVLKKSKNLRKEDIVLEKNMAAAVEEGSIQQADRSSQDTQIQNAEAPDLITLRRRTLIVTATIIAVVILALLGGVVITGYKLKEVIDQLDADAYKEFPSLSRNRGIVSDDVWSWIRSSKADMTLNPRSAHYLLQVSNNGKSLYQASLGSPPIVTSDETYEVCICVSSANLLNTRVYFELQVTQRVPWTLGLRTESFDADHNPDTDPSTGIWTIASAEGKIIINDGTPTPTLQPTPAIVGLYLDYAQGQVSFYDSVAKRHLHTYLTTFKEKLRFYAAVQVGMEETHGALMSIV